MLIKKCNHDFCHSIKKDSLDDDYFREILKKHSLSVTKQRLVALKEIVRGQSPLTADELFNRLPKGTCDLATVYRVLGQFVKNDIIATLNLSPEMVHYEYINPFHHRHHIICNNCQKIDYIENCHLEELEKSLLKLGYKDIKHKLEFFGTCKNCKNSNAA